MQGEAAEKPKRTRARKNVPDRAQNPDPHNDGGDGVSRGGVGNAEVKGAFAAGMRYVLARYWDQLEVGGNTYMLEVALRETVRAEDGKVPPRIIETNRGLRIYWEAEFQELCARFNVSRGLLAPKDILEVSDKGGRPTKGDSEWSDN